MLAGLGVRESAVQLGISHAHLSNIERGRCGASPGLLKRMAELYGVEMTALFSFTEDAA